jgi:heme-degrading monooxygenase HmoA
MIVEHVLVTSKAGQGPAFEAAFAAAQQVVAKAEGFVFVDLLRGIESPETYMVIVAWASVDADESGFKKSPLWEQFEGLIAPHLDGGYTSEHFDILSHYTG